MRDFIANIMENKSTMVPINADPSQLNYYFTIMEYMIYIAEEL